MKKRNGWCYAFWILIIVVLILALMVGLIAWGGSRNEDEVEGGNDVTVASVSISTAEMSLKMGATEEGTLTATVTMSDGTTSSTQTVNWTSSDPTVATVTETGYTASVTALQAGTTEITASVGTVTSAECTVTVAEADPATVKDVTISGTLALAYGDETGTALTANVTMSDGSDYEGNYAWTSSDDEEKVVKVTGSGATVTVTPVSCGEAEITVAVDDNKSATCTVTVSEDHTAAEAGRIIGSADFTEEQKTQLTVNGTTYTDSSVTVTYDSDTKTYTIDGLSAPMSADQAKALFDDSHEGCPYIAFIITLNDGETANFKAYNGQTVSKTWTNRTSSDDNSFVIDLTDHTEGDFWMEIEVTYAGGDEETYKVVLGEIFTPASTQEDLFAAVAAGGDVALTQDITLTTDKDEDASGSHTQKAAATLTIGDGETEIEVTLDLNGYKLARNTQNSSGYQYNTIHVTKNATLIVTDSSEDGSGVVDVTGNYNEALYNEGTAILMGGLFTRSNENGMVESSNGGDSSYTIENYGDLTIDGATVFNAGDYSTCVRNQYTTDSTKPATLTMISGIIYGGKYAVGSGSSTSGRYATFTMTGGTLGGLRSETDALPYRALNNYDQAIITGGTLLGGNGGAIDVGGANKADACIEGVVIFNEDGGTNHTLTIGDGNGNGPEIIYEGINPNAAVAGDDGLADTRLSYYDELSGETVPKFATGIAVYSGEVDFNAGTIKCSDETAAEDRDYNFMGVYITNGTLRATGGTISGDEAIVIDFTVATNPEIAYEVTAGCNLIGGIKIYGEDGQEIDVSAYEPGDVVVPGSDENFTFNDESFNGFSGLDKDFTVTDDEDEKITYTAGDITVTEIVGSDGKITVVVEGIVANQMSDEQKVAFDASYETDADGTIRFYIAVQIAVKPGETVTVTGGGKTEEITNPGDDVSYTLWVIEIGQTHFEGVTAETVGDYLVVDISTFTMTVSVSDSNSSEKGDYTIAFGNVFVPLQAWRCADGQHAVSNWTVVEEETCGKEGYQVGVCDYCGKIVTETIPATGNHDWDEGEVTTAPTCTGEGVLTKTCTVCGETKTETIPALGHTAKTYSDGNMYAVYKDLNEDGDCEWCALCAVCDVWFVIGDEDIYDFVLVAKNEASLDAAIAVAKARTDGSKTNRTQILVNGEITISDESYVTIDCDNVEIYGLSTESSKIIDSAYEENAHSGTAQDGVEISGKNVTIRDLTIDGSKLDESSNHYNLEHGLEIREGAENVTISNCVIIGGTSSGSSAVVLVGSNDSGYVLIENCTLSGYRGLMIERNNGDELDVTISGGTINGLYYGIHTEGLADVHTNGVCLVAENATINGKNSLGSGDSFTFTNCTFGFSVYDNAAYGSMNTYCDVTLTACTFLSNNTEYENTSDTLVNTSSNYVIQARVEGVTISLIDCKFENTYADLGTGTLVVTAESFVYLVGGKSSVKNCYLYFDDSEDAVKYFYDATEHTITVNNGEELGDDGNDGDDGEEPGGENP